MNASVIARIAKIIPLAVVAAIGAAACGPVENGSSAAPSPAHSATSAPTTAPAVSTPVPAATATPAAPAAAETTAETKPAAEPTVKPAAKPSAKPASAKPASVKPASAKPASSGGIGIAFTGISGDELLQLGTLVPFSVTWTNNDASGTRAVAPVVATRQFEGAPCTQVLAMAEGTLERRDASGWKTLGSLSQGGGMDYALSGNAGAFTLAAGESHTVEYRMRLSAANRPGKLTIEADAPTPNSVDFHDIAKAVVTTTVVDFGGPEVTDVRTAAGRIGTTPAVVGVTVFRPHSVATVRPEVFLSRVDGLQAQDVAVEVRAGGVWKPVEVKDGCNGLVAVAEPGQEVDRRGDRADFEFRITLKKDSRFGAELRVGAESEGHQAAFRTVFGPQAG